MSILDDIGEVLEDIWKAIKSLFSASPPASLVEPCPLKALSPEEAQAFFDKFRADPRYPWNYPTDCCYNRAEAMANELKRQGKPVGKAWIYAPKGKVLSVPTPDDPKGTTGWGYHVAPVVPVKQPDGSVQDMVLDPSISDTPLTLDQWRDKMKVIDPPDPNRRLSREEYDALPSTGTTTIPVITSSDVFYRKPDGTNQYGHPTEEQIDYDFNSHRFKKSKIPVPKQGHGVG